MKIIGLIRAYNEWPLLALSISHALENHVDEVYLLNHFRDANQYAQTRHLKELWGNRVHLLDYFTNEYYQEAQINALIHISQSDSPDWIWVFDADEFLLTSENQSLKKILSEISQDKLAVRYELKNWVSCGDFDENQLDHYLRLQQRAISTDHFSNLWSKVMHDEILRGKLNFFDIPFNSKVIFRGNIPHFWLAAGAHTILSPRPAAEIKTNQFEVAHFPFLSKNRLATRVSRKKQLNKQGFSPMQGWQSQMIASFHEENRMDDFWNAHSISDISIKAKKPSTERDLRFSQSIEPVIISLKDKLVMPESFACLGEDTQVPFDVLVQSFKKFKLMSADLQAKRSWWRLLKPSALWAMLRLRVD